MKKRIALAVVFLATLSGPQVSVAVEPVATVVRFNRDIRSLLSDKCLRCHGPDAEAREADLRLDERVMAVADRGGHAVIVPGNADASELMARVTSSDPDQRMPPAETDEHLTNTEVELLRAWINQGAVYQKHWSLEPLIKPPTPRSPPTTRSAKAESARNPIDAFVTARLYQRGRRLALEAAPETLLRRVTLDLTGLPPALDELQAFRTELGQPHADRDACYERVVARLLESKHFGEHLAVGWLDAARYADTNGYFGDKPRQMWLWRDWVIDAFNANMPFDQFTIEQLAGDLLPDATLQQRIATGFNRNHMANNETGIIDEEFRTEYVVDRVHTTTTTWLGLTAGCAQCHDHKFDPISQREFYQLFAFFNNVPESGLIRQNNPPPMIEVPSAEQQRRLAEVTEEAVEATQAFESVQERLANDLAAWGQDAANTLPKPPIQAVVLHEAFDGSLNSGAAERGTTLTFESGVHGQSAKFDATQHVEIDLKDFNPDGPWTIGFWLMPDGSLSCPLSLIEPTDNRRGIEMIFGKGLVKIHLVNRWGVSLIGVSTVKPVSARNWHHVVVCYDGSRTAGGLRVFVDGSLTKVAVRRDTLNGSIANAEPLRIGRRDSGLGFYGRLDEVRILQRALDEAVVGNWFWGERIRGILSVDAANRGKQDSDILLDYYVDRFADTADRAARQRLRTVKQAEQELRAAIPSVLVMQEMDEPRVAHVLERGQYDKPGEVVRPDVPAAIAPWPAGAPRNRLGFARWLVTAENPLTARVAANRLWQHCFGEGLVRTVDDFGSQGEPPTHPELLDWLAATFRDDGWDVKHLIELIVTSRTYKQRSQFAAGVSGRNEFAAAASIDPENRLLARGPSSRLSAEMLRDQALAVSGLLVPTLGGPSVKPYQPPGLWEAVSYNAEETYVPDSGDGLWRRSLYTYVKRQSPPPSLLTFDGPTREKCTMRRARTNTPLQALVMLNDDNFVEAARAVGARSLQAASSDQSRLQHLWQTVLQRDAQAMELDLLQGLLHRQRGRFARNPAAALSLLSVGAAGYDRKCEPGELAAWTVVAQTVLNLDEAITKR